MIVKVPTASGAVGLRPVGDSIPFRTWRTGEGKARHHYPTEGCHGAPLDAQCPCVKAGCDGRYCPGSRGACLDCTACNGTGRVQLDHPNRTDMP